ncbi:MAG: hypothetical protein GXP55_05055, partial [Deltaproteobacteria bacterium]|nr:hypothetical protein [Deltaproteobacteria bacterium]
DPKRRFAPFTPPDSGVHVDAIQAFTFGDMRNHITRVPQVHTALGFSDDFSTMKAGVLPAESMARASSASSIHELILPARPLKHTGFAHPRMP